MQYKIIKWGHPARKYFYGESANVKVPITEIGRRKDFALKQANEWYKLADQVEDIDKLAAIWTQAGIWIDQVNTLNGLLGMK